MNATLRSRSSVLGMIGVAVLAVLLTACASAGSAPGGVGASAGGDGMQDVSDDLGAPAVPQSSAAAGEDEGSGRNVGGQGYTPGGEAAPIEQRIIKTGEVSIQVDNVAVVLARVRAMANDLGGYVGGSQAGTLDDSATITLRVPAARFDELLSRLHELEDTKIVTESTREQDVTGDIVDLEARIRNLQASEESYRTLLERAEKIDDILAVQSRLDDVRGQIEQLQGQLKTIEGQADLSTLTVTLIPRSEPVEQVQEAWDPGAELKSAAATLVGIGQGLLDVLIWFVVVWLPVLIVLGLVALVGWRASLQLRRRVPAASGEPPATA